MEAQNLWRRGDQMRSDPFNTSCMYRLGCVALDKGQVEAAVYVITYPGIVMYIIY